MSVPLTMMITSGMGSPVTLSVTIPVMVFPGSTVMGVALLPSMKLPTMVHINNILNMAFCISLGIYFRLY